VKVYNKLLFTLVLTACLLNTLLAFFTRANLDMYFIVNLFAYLVITVLFVRADPHVTKALNIISTTAFTGLIIIIILAIINIT
jgi:hypothetical protein